VNIIFSYFVIIQKRITVDIKNVCHLFILKIPIPKIFLKYFDPFRDVYGLFRLLVFLVFFSMNVNKILFVGSKSLKIQYEVPDIFIQHKLKNIKNK